MVIELGLNFQIIRYKLEMIFQLQQFFKSQNFASDYSEGFRIFSAVLELEYKNIDINKI